GYVVVEMVFLVAAGVLFSLVRLGHWHRLWISYRHLAERVRSMFFAGVAGLSVETEDGGATGDEGGDPTERWIKDRIAEIAQSQPKVDPSDADIQTLRRYLAGRWIEDQARYHWRASERHRSWEARSGPIAIGLFLGAFLGAILHW